MTSGLNVSPSIKQPACSLQGSFSTCHMEWGVLVLVGCSVSFDRCKKRSIHFTYMSPGVHISSVVNKQVYQLRAVFTTRKMQWSELVLLLECRKRDQYKEHRIQKYRNVHKVVVCWHWPPLQWEYLQLQHERTHMPSAEESSHPSMHIVRFGTWTQYRGTMFTIRVAMLESAAWESSSRTTSLQPFMLARNRGVVPV